MPALPERATFAGMIQMPPMPESATRPASRPSFFAMCCEEPFRIFFPIGVLVGISGVSLWPLYFSGLHKFYPGVMHARMMIEGFMGAFIIGFLGTAGPRLTGTPPFARWELGLLLTLHAVAVGMHIGHLHFEADIVFLALLLVFAGRMAWRFSNRRDMPPPSFVLVGFGFLNAIAGTVLLIAGAMGDGNPRCGMLGGILLYQGFVTYLVLGIGGFLLPRFLNLPPRGDFPESRTPAGGWMPRAVFALAIGAVLLGTYVAEVFTPMTRVAGLVRCAAAAVFLLSEIPAHRSVVPWLTITNCLRVALAMIVLGLLFPVLWPAQRVAGLHVVFISGFTLVTFTVATRVVLGHSGFGHLFTSRLPFLIATAILLIAGMALRVAGDFALGWRGPLMDAASYLWMLAAALWGWRVLPKVRIAEPEA
jgi:uncharacterized protein involved in response to NO